MAPAIARHRLQCIKELELKALILCADDFGLTDGISEAIWISRLLVVYLRFLYGRGEAFNKYYEALLPYAEKSISDCVT